MSKTEEALDIQVSLGLPRHQQNERSALTLLALADIGPSYVMEEGRAALGENLGHHELHA